VTDHSQFDILPGGLVPGRRPGDRPVEQVTKLDLVVYLKAAGMINLVIPESFLVHAEVIA
jgi:hypothetical protein